MKPPYPHSEASPLTDTQINNSVQEVSKKKPTVKAKANEVKPKLQAPSPQPSKPKTVQAQTPPPNGCNTGNPYKDYIYTHESSCNPSAVNSIGCRGIAQACPGSKLPCGADFTCQDAYFTRYAIDRYGSWEQAYYFWTQNHWW